ncbi:MAG: hypothetical protein RI531_08350 [Haloferacaceae archaeon]|nr:hypothetical protein [Haloferacaceae archaeon]
MRQGRTLLLAALVVTGLLVGLGAVTAAEGDPTISMSSGSTPAGAGGVIVDDGLTVSGSGDIAGATISFASGYDAEVDALAVDSTAVSDAGLTRAYDDTTGVLTLTGQASPAEMQTVLRTVRYTYSRGHPRGGGDGREAQPGRLAPWMDARADRPGHPRS